MHRGKSDSGTLELSGGMETLNGAHQEFTCVKRLGQIIVRPDLKTFQYHVFPGARRSVLSWYPFFFLMTFRTDNSESLWDST